MNGYVCFYRDERLEVRATTSANAQIAAFNILQDKYPRRKVKAYEITVVLAEKNGEQVTHLPLF